MKVKLLQLDTFTFNLQITDHTLALSTFGATMTGFSRFSAIDHWIVVKVRPELPSNLRWWTLDATQEFVSKIANMLIVLLVLEQSKDVPNGNRAAHIAFRITLSTLLLHGRRTRHDGWDNHITRRLRLAVTLLGVDTDRSLRTAFLSWMFLLRRLARAFLKLRRLPLRRTAWLAKDLLDREFVLALT